MRARKIQDETEAREQITKMLQSGLTLAVWARSAAVDGRSLHAWSGNLSREAQRLAVERIRRRVLE
jgi:uncharacterized protein YoaH (UPF0181 family)